MALQFKDGYITSLFGRRMGLQTMTSGVSGSARVPQGEFLIGPDAFRNQATSAETTSVNLAPWGVSILGPLATTLTGYVLDPPIPGVLKTLVFNSSDTANATYVKLNAGTAGAITMNCSAGSTMCVLNSTAGVRAAVQLMGVNSTCWTVVGSLSTAQVGQTTAIV